MMRAVESGYLNRYQPPPSDELHEHTPYNEYDLNFAWAQKIPRLQTAKIQLRPYIVSLSSNDCAALTRSHPFMLASHTTIGTTLWTRDTLAQSSPISSRISE